MLFVLPLLATVPASDLPDRADAAELRGTWRLVALETGGEVGNLALGRPWVVIDGDEMRCGGEVVARLSADPAATPKVIDLHFAGPNQVFEGIYALAGDTLKVCLNLQVDGVKERPHVLETSGKLNWRLLTFVRDSPEEGDGSDQLPGYVGIADLTLNEERQEWSIEVVRDASPAKRAGLRKDDVLLKVGDEELADLDTMISAVRRTKPGRRLVFRIRRDGVESDVAVRVGQWPFRLVANLQ